MHKICLLCNSSWPFTGRSESTKVESVQYSAALAITGAWRGTSREKIYSELGWESLYSRRWSKTLFMLYKIINNLMPDYISEPIPNLNQSNYNLRKQPVIGKIRARTAKYKASFFPDSLLEWSKLDPVIRESPSLSVFKSRLLPFIRPPSNSVFGIHDPHGLALLTQLRVIETFCGKRTLLTNFRTRTTTRKRPIIITFYI